MTYLLDTNTCVSYLRQGAASPVAARLAGVKPGEVVLCSVVVSELLFSALRSRDLAKWETLPIALAPSLDAGEAEVWSGCCTIDGQGKPMIFYTSIAPGKSADLPRKNIDEISCHKPLTIGPSGRHRRPHH